MTDEERMQAIADSMGTIGEVMQDWLGQFVLVFEQMCENVATWYEENREAIIQSCRDLDKPEVIDALEAFHASVRGRE